MPTKPVLAVVSPYVDRRHGTERCVAEWVSRLAREYDLHLYSLRVEDVELAGVTWHRLPRLPGPHLVNYLWWLAANHVARWWGTRVGGLRFDLVFSPGVNCLDADVMTVHVLFAELRRQLDAELSLRRSSLRSWPRLLHRRLFYRLIGRLERRLYTRAVVPLAVFSAKTAADLKRHYGRTANVSRVEHGVDPARFHPRVCAGLRPQARATLGLPPDAFAVLLGGTDWRNKGLRCLLEAAGRLGDPALQVLVVGEDDPSPFRDASERYALGGRIACLPPRPDVEFYYAAADAYVGPSLEDAFGLPAAEAMACGLPVIASRRAGVSEWMTHGEDSFVLEDPTDAAELARLLRRLRQDSSLRERLGQRAAVTARQFSWEKSAARMQELFQAALQRPAGGLLVGLFTDLLPLGGVQRAGRHTAAVLAADAERRGLPYRFLSLNDPPGFSHVQVGEYSLTFEGFGRRKGRYVRAALALARAHPRLVLALHPHLAPVVWAMKALDPALRAGVVAHGVEVWTPLALHRRWALCRADSVAAPSRATAEALVRVQGVAAEKVRHLPWGLDPEFIAGQATPGGNHLPEGFPRGRVVLSVGRLAAADRYKGTETLLEAVPGLLSTVADLHLVVVGDGDDRPRLEKLAHSLGVAPRVHFLGEQPPQALLACYRHCDVFALPSKGEGFGLVFLEAMAQGKPVVASAQGGTPDVIEDGVTGYLVPFGDVGRLAARLEALLTNDSLRREMGQRAQASVGNCARFERFEADLLRWVEDLCAS